MVMGETEEIIGSSMITFDKTRMMSIEQGHPRTVELLLVRTQNNAVGVSQNLSKF